jgi:poly(hydroxyalkanoate) granule-associated protein
VEKKVKGETAKQKAAQTPTEQVLAAGRAAVETAQEAVEKAQEAVEKIHQEGGRLLESLMKEGEKVIDDAQKKAGAQVGEMKSRVETARNRAADSFDNLEQIFEDRVSRALSRLGIPTRDDFQSIAKRLEALNNSVKILLKEERVEEGVKALEEEAAGSHILDDLKAITGVGPALEAKLNATGINSYRQIAELDEQGIADLDAVIKSAGRIKRDNWVDQAKKLHFEKYKEQL